LKYASGPVSRACSRAGPACLPLPLAGPRCLRPRPACVRPAGPLPLLAAAARAHRALAGPRPPLPRWAALPRACAPPRWPLLAHCRYHARAPRRARPACRCHASCRLLGHALAAALGRARAHACWAAPALALLGCAEPLWAAFLNSFS